jgi:hypothetical protein
MPESETYPPLNRVEAGIDWLTLTLRPDATGYTQWRGHCLERLQLWVGAGNLLKSTSRLGYEGLSCGGAFVGEREDGSIAIYTGGLAAHAYVETYHPGVRCSRLDAEVTIRLSDDDPTYGQHRYSEAIRANDLLPEKRQRKLREYKTHKGGATYYIGSRSSPEYGRIYDKMRESKEDHYINCWRYEVECHNECSTKLYHYLHVVDIPLPGVIKSFVARWYTRRGVLCPFWLEGCPDALWPKVTDKSDASRRLKWLREQVAPAIRTLRLVSNDATIAEALGIDLAVIPWVMDSYKED